MKSTACAWKRTSCALLLATAPIVFLTACSTLYGKKGDGPKPSFTLTNDAHTPDIPPHLVKCIEQQPKGGKTADELVVNRMQTEQERKICSEKILQWYKDIQAANAGKPAPKPKK